MNVSKLVIVVAFFCLLSSQLLSQDNDRKITFPDLDEYKTLKCDFHIHSIFSDGLVWPTIRVEEAVKDGLDAISLTEHIEYQPWAADMRHPDRNRSYHLAQKAAKPHDLIVIHGTEITREMPPGHANALFVTDVNSLIVQDSIEAYRLARQQGAFIFWNHPNWVSQNDSGIPVLSDLHKQLIAEDLLHGIEVVNDVTYSEEALKIALENDLSVIGTSDIHGLVDWQFRLDKGGHRPINLVFAEERSEESIKEALFAGRCIAWFENILTGRKEWVEALINKSLVFRRIGMLGPSSILEVEITNVSDAPFLLENLSEYDFYNHSDLIEVPPHSEVVIRILSEKIPESTANISFKILNAQVGYKENAILSYQFQK